MPWTREDQRAYERSVHDKVLSHYGTACACCGATEDLSIDHVSGDGAEHGDLLFGDKRARGYRFHLWIIRNGFPDGFQVLCRPCNHSKAKTSRCWLRHGRFPEGLKLCNNTRHEGPNPVPLEDFYRNRQGTDGRLPQCKACQQRDDPVRRPRKGVNKVILRGEQCYSAVLTAEIVLACRERRRGGETVTALAREFGVSVMTMSDALRGRTWKWLEERSKK